MNAQRPGSMHGRMSLAAVSIIAVAGGPAAASMIFPTGVHQTFAVTTDNRLYAYDMNTHALTLRHAITGLQPGETIRGIDFKHIANDPTPPTDLFMLGSTGAVYLLDFIEQSGSYQTSVIASLGGAGTGASVGFDVRYQAWTPPPWGGLPGMYPFIYASRSDDGLLAATTPVQHSGGSWAHYADGSPAHIGGLASYDDSSAHFLPWGLIGIDTARQQFVNIDPQNPAQGPPPYPTRGLCTPITTFTGPTGTMDLSSMAGFDTQEWFEQIGEWNWRSDVYGVMALNEAGSDYTSLYAMRTPAFGAPFGGPIAFEKVGDLVLDDPGPVRFSAVAMIPTPGATLIGVLGMAFAFRRSRR